MQVTDELIRNVVQEVLAHMHNGKAVSGNGKATGQTRAWGVFEDVDGAVAAAADAQKQFEARGLEDRRKAVACMRRICIEQAETLGREELEETRIGRLDHKIEKLKVCGEKTPGVEFLRTDAYSGENGVTLTEYAPFGVVGIITPVTHSLPTLAGNAINILAAGNALVCNPHPGGARIACRGTQLFNKAIYEAIGIDNLLTIIGTPTLESAQAIFDHRGVRLLCVTGGPAVGRAALRSPKRAIVAGPGNPPVVVDETADLDLAARSIVAGGAYDNNLLCIGEKEVFAVEGIFNELMEAMTRHKAHRLDRGQIEALTKVAFVPAPEDKSKRVVNKDLIGQDPAVLAERAGFKVPAGTELLFGETEESHPFVDHEQMMPFVPFVRVPNVDAAIALAKKYEHGFKHTAIIHSRNVETITRMGRELDTSLFVQNGASMACLGVGGEGYLSFSIATPTGEGVTTPLTFTRQRRSTTVGSMRVL
ncbi:MAG TPA: aldehyde dehydrogenase family protein [Gemmataceae bacterium]|jgi:aldehyde dehydrogenase|nr:aldehyde dehydrogenase family protein [Gemmataceae bacterium]